MVRVKVRCIGLAEEARPPVERRTGKQWVIPTPRAALALATLVCLYGAYRCAALDWWVE